MTTENIGNGRPLRGCNACGQLDDHPRHGFGRSAARDSERFVDDRAVAAALAQAPAEDRDRIELEMSGTRGLAYHLDCCRALGCQDCANVPADLRGGQLLDHILNGAENG